MLAGVTAAGVRWRVAAMVCRTAGSVTVARATMNGMTRLALAALLPLILTGCGTAAPDDARSIAEELAAEIDGATVVEVTPDDDPQGIFERDNPPASMAVIELPGSTCTLPNAPCGAAVKVYDKDAEGVRRTAAYLQAMLTDGSLVQVRDNVELVIDGRQDAITKAQLMSTFNGSTP